MKKWLPWIITAVFAAWLASSMRPPREKTEFNTREFGRLPVLLNGRIQPLDSVAANSLLSMSGKRTVRVREKKTLTGAKATLASITGSYPRASENEWWVTVRKLNPTEWLLDVMIRPEEADRYKIFRIQHPDVATLAGGQAGKLDYLSFNDLLPKLQAIEEQARRIGDKKQELRTPFEKDVSHLYNSIILYHRLKNSLRPESWEDAKAELEKYRGSIASGLVAVQKSQSGGEYNQEDLARLAEYFRIFRFVDQYAYPLIVPPTNPGEARDEWVNIGKSLMESLRSGEVHPALTYYATMASAYRAGQAAIFNTAAAQYRDWLVDKSFTPEVKKGQREYFFNQIKPFYKSMVMYVIALLLGCVFWLNWSEVLRKSAFSLLTLGFLVHTSGLIFRMVLEGRPPVTNLYSSAIFVGWGIVIFGLILERIFKAGIGVVVAGLGGFVTQIIAHHLSLNGDTMEMLRAVLDTNFWLATHVVVITAGYSAMFVMGLAGIAYIILGVFTRLLSPDIAKILNRSVYGIACFATLFSFVGTVLGGIWADQSWGRFWGWDPKENGALLIVIWCAIMLHARWGGLVKERGMMAMAVFGNVITSFSWFGVNMLGVGLHSYGFMDKAFKWLLLFVVTQVVIIGLAYIPSRFWLSFKSPARVPVRDKSQPVPSGKTRPASAAT
jgi:ABC-type transport system involved in cytochrome c biogenesis permease subunit